MTLLLVTLTMYAIIVTVHLIDLRFFDIGSNLTRRIQVGDDVYAWDNIDSCHARIDHGIVIDVCENGKYAYANYDKRGDRQIMSIKNGFYDNDLNFRTREAAEYSALSFMLVHSSRGAKPVIV